MIDTRQGEPEQEDQKRHCDLRFVRGSDADRGPCPLLRKGPSHLQLAKNSSQVGGLLARSNMSYLSTGSIMTTIHVEMEIEDSAMHS
jgi:hypothetical protein